MLAQCGWLPFLLIERDAQDQQLRSSQLHLDVGLRIISENLVPESGDKDLKGPGCSIQDAQLSRVLGLPYGVIDH